MKEYPEKPRPRKLWIVERYNEDKIVLFDSGYLKGTATDLFSTFGEVDVSGSKTYINLNGLYNVEEVVDFLNEYAKVWESS